MKYNSVHDIRTCSLDDEQKPQSVITEAAISELPTAIQRYVRYAQVVGKVPIQAVHLRQEGSYRTRPGQKWFPMHAEQGVITTPPSFLWRMTSRLLPLVSLTVTDGFAAGHGSLQIRLGRFIPLAHAQGPEIDAGELQRYLLEMAWYPTAWLSPLLSWRELDASSVEATVCSQGLTASALLHINAQGQLTRLTAQRFHEERGHKRLEPWSGHFEDYQEVGGIRIPTRFEATWHLASGAFTWIQGRLTEVAYTAADQLPCWHAAPLGSLKT